MFKSLILIVLLSAAATVFAQEPAPADILRKADEARGNIAGQAVQWTVSLTTTREDDTKEMQLHIIARGSSMFTEILAPDKVKGQKLLVSEGEMWFYKPGLSRVISVPRRQKLLGDASTGDITSTDYAGEYDATALPEEKVGDVACYVFDLKAKTHAVTYDRIKYWISKTRSVGVKAEFYSVSGKKLKTVTLEHHDNFEIAGKKRAFISKMTIIDELAKDKVTTLDFSAPASLDVPADFFSPDHLAGGKPTQ